MTRLIDADKLYPDCMTKDGTFAISQSQIANAPTVEVTGIKKEEANKPINWLDRCDDHYLSDN